MSKGIIRVYYGDGRGKSTAALGDAIRAAGEGKRAVIVQFLKGNYEERKKAILDRLEPEVKFFRFAKSESAYDALSEEEKKEENVNLLNAFHYGKKVVTTGESDFVVFDEILGLLDRDILPLDEIRRLILATPPDTILVFTGRVLPPALAELANEVYHIESEKEQEFN